MSVALRALAAAAHTFRRGRVVAGRSRLFVVGDDIGWSIDDDRARLTATARPARVRRRARAAGRASRGASPSSITSHFERCGRAGSSRRTGSASRTSTGVPARPGIPEFDACLRGAAPARGAIDRVQVTHAEMQELVLAAGVEPAKVLPDPDRDRRRALSARRRRRAGGGAARARPAGVRVRRRLVPEGRRRAGARASSRSSIKGPDVLVAVARAPARARSRALRPAHRAGARLRPRRARAARRSRTGTCARARATSSARAYHALDVYLVTSRAGGRAEGGARVDGGRRAARDDAGRPGGGARRATARTACWSTSRTSTALVGAVGSACTTTASSRERLRRGPRDRRARLVRARSTRAGPELLDGFVASRRPRMSGLTGAGRPVRARGRALGAAARRRGGRAPGVRVFYGHDRVPAPGRAGRGRLGEVPAARDALPEPPDRLHAALPRLDLAAARPRAAALARAAAWRSRSSSTRTASAYPGLGGRADRGAQPAAPPGAPRRRPRPLPERVLQALGRPVPRRAAGGSWEILHNAVDVERFTPAEPRPRRARPAARRRPDPGATGSSSALRTLAALLASQPDARLLVTGRLVSPVEPLIDELGLRGPRRAARPLRAARRARAHPARARPAAHEGEGPVPERRDRGDGVRASGRLPGERRHVELVGDEAGHRRPAPDRLGARRAAEPGGARGRGDRGARRPARGTPRRRVSRAVERFALEPVARPPRRAVRRPPGAASAPIAARRARAGSRAWKRARAGSRRASASAAPPTGRTSIRATVRGRVACLRRR